MKAQVIRDWEDIPAGTMIHDVRVDIADRSVSGTFHERCCTGYINEIPLSSVQLIEDDESRLSAPNDLK